MGKPKRLVMTVPAPPGAGLPLVNRLPADRPAFWEHLHCKAGSTMTVLCVMNSLLPYHCHYVKGTYVPCYLEQQIGCPYHEEGGPRTVYRASLAVWSRARKRMEMTDITAGALAEQDGLEWREDLLGRLIEIRRDPGGRNAPMHVNVKWDNAPQKWHPDKAVTKEQLWRQLLNFWGVELRPVTERNDQ